MKITKRELNMNKNIELIKRWIADNDSVSYKELRDNMDDAVRASELVDAVVYAADYAMADYPEDAAYWVNICEELIAGIDSTLGDPSSVSVPHDDLPMSEHIKQLVKQGR